MSSVPWVLFAASVALVSCSPNGKNDFDRLEPQFVSLPREFSRTATAVWWSSYEEDVYTHRFKRVTMYGRTPEKLDSDDDELYTVAIVALKQEEDSDGPHPDTFVPLVVNVLKADDRFKLLPNDFFKDRGAQASWVDRPNRTVHYRGLWEGRDGAVQKSIVWQIRGRY